MFFFKFNIGDYASHTRHLSIIEDIAYRRLLDLAYTTEKPIKNDIREISRLINMRDYQQEISDVLNEFWELLDGEGWVNNRVLKEIEETGTRSVKASQSAKMRWEKKKNAELVRAQCAIDANASLFDANELKNDATQDTLHTTQDTVKSLVPGKPVDDCPHQEIISLYHDLLPTMPSIKIWTEKRKKILQARWRESEKRQNLDFWKRFFVFVSESDFLCGRTAKPFNCDLEWLITSSNFVKVIEGKYVNQ